MPITPGRTPSKIVKSRTIEERRARVADFILMGRSAAWISLALSIGRATVDRDVRAIRKEWEDRRLDGHDAKVARQLARVDRIEAETWDAWERSKAPQEKTITRSTRTSDGSERLHSELVKVEQVGDPSFLATLTRLQQIRMEIEGTKAPVRQDVEVRLGVDDVFPGGDTLKQAIAERDAFANDPRFKPRGLEDMRGNGSANGSAASDAVVDVTNEDDDDENDDGGGTPTLQ